MGDVIVEWRGHQGKVQGEDTRLATPSKSDNHNLEKEPHGSTAWNPVLLTSFAKRIANNGEAIDVERLKQCCTELQTFEKNHGQRAEAVEPTDEDTQCDQKKGRLCKWLTGCFDTLLPPRPHRDFSPSQKKLLLEVCEDS